MTWPLLRNLLAGFLFPTPRNFPALWQKRWLSQKFWLNIIREANLTACPQIKMRHYSSHILRHFGPQLILPKWLRFNHRFKPKLFGWTALRYDFTEILNTTQQAPPTTLLLQKLVLVRRCSFSIFHHGGELPTHCFISIVTQTGRWHESQPTMQDLRIREWKWGSYWELGCWVWDALLSPGTIRGPQRR